MAKVNHEEYWGEGRAVYRRRDVPANGDVTPILTADEDLARVSRGVGIICSAAVQESGLPVWLQETENTDEQ